MAAFSTQFGGDNDCLYIEGPGHHVHEVSLSSQDQRFAVLTSALPSTLHMHAAPSSDRFTTILPRRLLERLFG